MTGSYFITTPIYYVNGSPHIGHAYTSIAADVLARFHRSDGRHVFFLTGVDEHGQKVEKAAAEAGKSPQAFVDEVAADFRAVARRLEISCDDFIRTTEPRHARACAALWERLLAAGQIYLGSYAGWYSVRDETFFGEDELVTRPDGTLAAPTGADVEWLSEPSYFFRLSAWQDALLRHYENHPDFIGPPAKRNEVISFVRSGLKDLSISRTSFRWGIPVPGEPAHVMYVWFDALANYISALGWPNGEGQNGEGQNGEGQNGEGQNGEGQNGEGQGTRLAFWPADLHVVGKEIVRFHAVYWPAILMAAGLAPPRRIYSHGWWTIDGQKISKSLGNGIDPVALVDEFGLDPVRFFLLREVPFGNDGDFSRRALIGRMNVELANDLGNLAQRTLSLVARQLDGMRPEPGPRTDPDQTLLAMTALLPDLARSHLAREAFGDALEEVWRVIRASNAYIDQQAPWALSRSDPARMQAVLRVLLDALRIVGTVLEPFMPSSMARLLDQLGVPEGMRTLTRLGDALASARLPPPKPIFPRFVEDGPAA